MKKVKELTKVELDVYQSLATKQEKQKFLKTCLSTGANLKKSEVSSYKLKLVANKSIKAELYSLSGAIKLALSGKETIPYLNAIKVKPEQLTPAFILALFPKAGGKYVMNGKEAYQVVYIKGQKAEVLKSKWSAWDVLTIAGAK